MRGNRIYAVSAMLAATMLAANASAEVKKTAYPAVKVEVAQAYKPDAGFEKMRKAFAEASQRKDANAVFALVAPGFAWTQDGALASDFDVGRAPLHNFKVLFGFRELGKNADGGVADGPFWEALNSFASDGTYYKTGTEPDSLVCGPITATVENDDTLAQAKEKIESGDDAADWYFTLRETPVLKSPNDKGAAIATLGTQAFPMLRSFPAAQEGQPAPLPTHYEILLPTGKTGWISAAAARPLESNRLCYALTDKGEWSIGLYESTGGDTQDENGD